MTIAMKTRALIRNAVRRTRAGAWGIDAFAALFVFLQNSRFMLTSLSLPLAGVCAALLTVAPSFPQAKPPGPAPGAFPSAETLLYSVEWRLIYAGNARWTLNPVKGTDGKPDWHSDLHLESAGLVSKLYKLDDNYSTQLEDGFCTTATDLEATEGKKHFSTKVHYDDARHKATYVERDLIKNNVIKQTEVDIPPCTSDIIGSIFRLRTLRLEPGQSTQVPVSDGKKSAMVRVEAQEREQIQTKAGTFKTVRYEAMVFSGVIYQRKARVFVWLTDDARKLPVQIRVRMNFPIGSITLQLDKDGNS